MNRWPGAGRRQRVAALADLPIAVDLLAAALRGGAAPQRAALQVGAALAGPVGDRFVDVGRALQAGLSPAVSWTALSDLPEGGRIVRAAVRSAEHGTALAGVLERLATDLRATRLASASAAVRRASVLGVLPLGLCFLPAFLLTGVVPVVITVLGQAWQST